MLTTLRSCAAALGLTLAITAGAGAHIIGDEGSDSRPHPHATPATVWESMLRDMQTKAAIRRLNTEPAAMTLAQSGPMVLGAEPARGNSAPAAKGGAPAIAAPFQAFAPAVTTRWDDKFLYVESNGVPAHNMMIGITAWQQQVPLPQKYTGANAWRIPLHPVVAKTPAMIKGRFLRGAVALAVNGIPIFNPQNNRGEVSQEIGELDQWGGHCGRADDYHYHITPMHLQSVVGKTMPVAYALDGYPIYGLNEPNGAAPGKLDALNGHELPGVGYHYHGSNKYPYVNGGFHGEVVEAEGQVDPQPKAQPVRESLTALRGAKITGFTSKDKSFSLKYEVNGQVNFVNVTTNSDGSYKFDFVDSSGSVRTETYTQRQRGPGGGGGGKKGPDKKGPDKKGEGKKGEGKKRGPEGPQSSAPADSYTAPSSGNMKLTSSVVAEGQPLPVEFSGNGAGISPPLEWNAGPAGTRSYAIIMHHIPGPGDVKWYWTLYNIPANVRSLAKGSKNVGVFGTNSNGPALEYSPPHSKGPGVKNYTITVYALSESLRLNGPANRVDRAALLAAMKGKILDSATLNFTFDSGGSGEEGGKGKGGRREGREEGPGMNKPGMEGKPGDPPPPPPPPAGGQGGGRGPQGGGPRFIPREADEKLNLTDEQRQQIEALEKESREKLNAILTPEQQKILQESRPQRGGGQGRPGGPGEPGPEMKPPQ